MVSGSPMAPTLGSQSVPSSGEVAQDGDPGDVGPRRAVAQARGTTWPGDEHP